MGIKVSVIIPVYDVSDYIERCMRSVINQTYGNIECIIVDDATPDDSIVKCERLIEEYNDNLNHNLNENRNLDDGGRIRFKIVHHERNRGLSAARNTGTNVATGDYIFYLDSDDEITDDCIEKLVRPVENDKTIEMVVGNYMNDSHGNKISRKQQEKDLNSHETIREFYFCQKGFYVNAWNKLVKKAFIERHQINFKEGVLWEDNLWTFYLLKYISHLYIISAATYLHYKTPHSITAEKDREKKVHHWKLVYEEIAQNFTEGEWGKEAKFYIKYLCIQFLRNQKNQELCQVSRPYLKALYDDHYIKEFLFYYIVISLSKSSMGRAFLHYSVNKLIRYHK